MLHVSIGAAVQRLFGHHVSRTAPIALSPESFTRRIQIRQTCWRYGGRPVYIRGAGCDRVPGSRVLLWERHWSHGELYPPFEARHTGSYLQEIHKAQLLSRCSAREACMHQNWEPVLGKISAASQPTAPGSCTSLVPALLASKGLQQGIRTRYMRTAAIFQHANAPIPPLLLARSAEPLTNNLTPRRARYVTASRLARIPL